MRPVIKAQVKQEQTDAQRAYNSIICDNGVLAAKATFLKVCAENKKRKGEKSGFSKMNFKSRKGTKHTFSIDRLPSCLSPILYGVISS